MPTERWHQHNITFADPANAQEAVVGQLLPALLAAQDAGQLRRWWFMNKAPWPLRYRAVTPSQVIERCLDQLIRKELVVSWLPSIYEPETTAFGGPAAMEVAHDLFHADSSNLLTYRTPPGRLGRRETLVILASAMMRAAGLDWFEQGDVWAKYADFRPAEGPVLSGGDSRAITAAMRTLMIADTRSLCRPGAPLGEHAGWVTAFERAGASLAGLAATGGLSRGLRAVIAHHLIFHANRAHLPREDQHVISNIAREVVMGTSDNTASPTGAHPVTDNVTAVNNDTVTPPQAEAERLRNNLVDQIIADGHARTPEVEAALRSVPRHEFVPDVSLTEAYANTQVNIKSDTDGTSISCASQPRIVALMLDQLQVRPGQRVLELGAGSGYNAALLAHLVGEEGHVTTIDVDEDLVEGARAHLAAAGYSNVEAITRDGALGHADGSPYDRIIATVGAHGIPHAWLDQLASGGSLLVPQRLKGSVSRSIVYENHDGVWLSCGSEMNTFMPLRRGVADDGRQVVPLSADGTVRLQAPASQAIDVEALAGVLELPRVEEWTEVTVQGGESPEWMELFVSCSVPSGLIRMLFPQSAKGTLLTDDPYPSATAAVDKGAVTYLARRLSDKTTPEGGKLWEFGVIGHGPGSDELAAKVADAVRTWGRDHRGDSASFELMPLDASPEERPGQFIIDTPLNRVLISW